MEHFQIGFISAVGTAFFSGAYLLEFASRRLRAWLKREPGPKDRVAVIVLIAATFGFLAGSVVQPLWDKGVACKAAGQPLGSCVFFPN